MDDRQGVAGWTTPVAAALSLGAAAVHFAVVGEHFAEYALFGLLFAGLAWFQAGWALWYFIRPERPLAVAGAVVNGGVVLVWAASRTIGLPLGPHAWTAEPVGALDLTATMLEVALVGLLVALIVGPGRQPDRAPRRGRPTASVAAGAAVAIVALATSVALAMSGGSAHAEHHDDHVHEASSTVPTEHPAAHDDHPTEPTPTSARGGDSAPSSDPATPRAIDTPAATSTASSDISPHEPGSIVFGTDLDAAGRITEPANRFADGELAVWVASLRRPAGTDVLRLVVVQRLADGREFVHSGEDIHALEPGQRTIVSAGRPSYFAHGGSGRYVMRYLAGDTVLAEGAFEITP